MTIKVCYFGLLADRRGLAEERVTTAARTPAALYAELDAAYHLGLATPDFRAAVDDEFVPWDRPLAEGDMLALLPPMSGG